MRYVHLLFICYCVSGFAHSETTKDSVLHTLQTVVKPSYHTFLKSAQALHKNARLCRDNPNLEHLNKLKAAFHTCKDNWEHMESMLVGPAALKRFSIDFWPTRSRTITNALQAPITADSVADLGSAAKGLPGLGWALFSKEPDQVIAKAARLDYAIFTSQLIAQTAEHMLKQWQSTEESALLAASAHYEATSATPQQALDGLINALHNSLNRMIRQQLEKPLGLEKGKGPRPQNVESATAKRALRDLYHNLLGIHQVLGAKTDKYSLIALLNNRQAQAGTALATKCQTAVTIATSMRDKDLAILVKEDPEAVHELLQSLKALRIELKTRTKALLGVTIHFGDSDGD